MPMTLKSRTVQLGLSLVVAIGTALLFALWGPTQIAAAATIPVTTINDEYGTGAETCSLREAITAANTDAAFGGCVAGSGSDVVSVPAGVFVLTRAGANEDDNATGDLDIRSALVVSGAGSSLTILDANQIDRVLHVPMADVDLNLMGLTVQNGLASDSSGGGAYVPEGGAVITDSEFVSNTASLDGGGAFVAKAVTVTNSSFISNTAITSTGTGGGLYANDRILIENSRFEFNGGNGIFSPQGGVVIDSTFVGNRTNERAEGGGISTGQIYNFATSLEVHNSHFISNESSSYGGGLYTNGFVMVTNSTFTDNMAHWAGGGLYANNVVIQNSLFQSNHILFSIFGVELYGGGGLEVRDGGGTISNTSFISNSAGDIGRSFGGAIHTNGGASMTIVNSLFLDNIANSVYGPNGAAVFSGGSLSILHSTIVGTQVITGCAICGPAGGIGRSLIRNTIITSHTIGIETDPAYVDQPDVTSRRTEDHNLFYGNGTDRVNVIPSLDSLNGDPAFVNPSAGDFHLRPESAAINRGLDIGITPDFDGNPRLPGIAPDIGFLETPKILVAGLTVTNTSPQLQDVPVNFTASITAGSGVSYTWLFDDGFSGTGITTTHAYEVPGHYTVTVLAIDQYGWTILARTPVTITEPQNPNLAGTLKAEFVGSLVTYTLVVSNPNPVITATNVIVSGSVPPGTELVSTNGISSTSGGYYGLGYVSLPTTTLTPTQQITLTWTVAVPELKGSIITHAGAASDTAVIDRRVLVRVVFHTYLPVLSRE